MTGPAPPHIEAMRNQTGNTLRYIAELAEDPVSALLGSLNQVDGAFDQAKNFLRAEFYSEDVPEGFAPKSFKCLIPLVVGVDDKHHPAALGSVESWSTQSCRADKLAEHIGKCAVYLARHCSDYARSSGGWVYFGDLVQHIAVDGFAFQSYALAAHGLA
eukprot:6839180-Pyramimonas_sp.AAC.1